MIADRLIKLLSLIVFKKFIKFLRYTTITMAITEPLSNAC